MSFFSRLRVALPLLVFGMTLGLAQSGRTAETPPVFIQEIATARAGQTITIPAGAFAISTIKIPTGVIVQGSGALATRLTIQPGGAGLVIDNVQKATLRNLTITNTSSTAVSIFHARDITVQRLLINEGVIAVKVTASTNVKLDNLVGNHCQVGVSINGSTKVSLVNSTCNANNTCGISLINVTDCVVFNNVIAEVGTGTTLGGVNTRLALDYNLYKALYVGGTADQGRINVGTWSTLSGGQDLHSVQFPVAFRNPTGGDFTPTATLDWDPSRPTVSGWGVASLQGITAPNVDLTGAKRRGVPDLGAVAVPTGATARYAGFFEISNDNGRKSAGLFTPAGKVVRYLFQDLPFKKGRYGFVLPSYDQYGQPVPPGNYEVRVAEGQLRVKYLMLTGNNGTNNDLRADSDSTRRVAFSPTGDLLIGMGWGERACNIISVDPSYKKARWAFPGGAEPVGICHDGKMIYFAKSEGNNMLLLRIDPLTGLPIPWAGDVPMLSFPTANLGAPQGLVYLDNRLYLADVKNNRLLGGDVAGPAFTEAIAADAPSSLSADTQHHLLWFVSKKEKIVAVDSTGKIVASLALVEHPIAVAVAGNHLAVADAGTGKVALYTLDNPQAPVLVKSLGSGDGPYGAYSPTRFRFQEFRGVQPFGCILSLTPDGTLAVFDRYLSVFAANGTLLHSSYSQFGNAPRRVQGTMDGKVHFFDQNGQLSWIDDPKTFTWQPGGLYYVPGKPSGCVGFFTADGLLFGVYNYDMPINEKDKKSGIVIMRFEKYIGRMVAYYTQSYTTRKFVVMHDDNDDGVIDVRDGDGTTLDPQPPFVSRRFMYVDEDGSIRVMERTANIAGYVMKFQGLDAQQRPIYDTSQKNSPLCSIAKHGSPYQPDQTVDLAFGSESTMTPDGGMVLGAFDKCDPLGMGFSNSGATNLARLSKSGDLLWFLPLNDYGPIQGIKSLGNFLLTSWGHQAEWIGLDPDGLQLGHFGYPADAEWSGYWLDHPDHYAAFDNPAGTVSISAGDYMRNGQHWLTLSGAHTYVKHRYPVTLTAQSFLPDIVGAKRKGYSILARAEQPRLTIKKLDAPLAIDGDMAKWRVAGVTPQITLLPHGGGIKGPQDCSGVVRLAYEGENLYVQVIRFDDVITMHQPWSKSYLQDSTEMMINGFMTGFQFSVSKYTDVGVGIVRRRFFGGKLDKVLPADHCPARVTVYDSPKDIPERSIIEDNYGVDLSRCKVLVMEYKLPIDAVTYDGDLTAKFPVASGKSTWIGFMLDDNDNPGTDYQHCLVWPANYNTFADKEVAAYCTFE